jgi:D-3-phosphoglycerate dehydrogenase
LQQALAAIAVGCFCIGTNQVDLEKAEEYGIPVFKTRHLRIRAASRL